MILFYEKPGCINNTRQKRLLAAAGVRFEARDLLTEPWSAERLRPFFGERSVSEWFNRTAPRIKSGEVVPEALGEGEALAAMLADPLLIRRPLIAGDGWHRVGFEREELERLLGVVLNPPGSDTEACPRDDGHACNPTEATP